MTTVLLVVAGLMALGLFAFDVWQSRREDRFAPEERRVSDGLMRTALGRAARGGSTVPGVARTVVPIAIVYGFLSFPATLAPVILTVLALQKSSLGGDGTVALASMLMAGLSMSAGIKAWRAGSLLLIEGSGARRVVVRSIAYLALWSALTVLLLTLARPDAGPVAMVTYVYVATTVVVLLLLRWAQHVSRPQGASEPDAF